MSVRIMVVARRTVCKSTSVAAPVVSPTQRPHDTAAQTCNHRQ